MSCQIKVISAFTSLISIVRAVIEELQELNAETISQRVGSWSSSPVEGGEGMAKLSAGVFTVSHSLKDPVASSWGTLSSVSDCLPDESSGAKRGVGDSLAKA